MKDPRVSLGFRGLGFKVWGVGFRPKVLGWLLH